MAQAKRHHYLPQFYLGYFCSDGLLWVYDRDLNQYRRQSPVNTATQGHYYSFEEEDGTKNTEIEEMLSQIESAVKPVLSKLDQHAPITPDEREILALFVYFFMTRGPDFEEQVNDMVVGVNKKIAQVILGSSEEQTTTIMKQYEMESGKRASITPKDLVDFIERDEYDVTVHRTLVLA